jgi:hypothetical protein
MSLGGAFNTESKSESLTQTQEPTVTSTNYGDGVINAHTSTTAFKGKGNTINLTDSGAVAAGERIAASQIEFAEGAFSTTAQLLDQTFGTAMGMVSDAAARTIEIISGNSQKTIEAIERAGAPESSEQGRMLFLGAAAIMGIVAVVMIGRALK